MSSTYDNATYDNGTYDGVSSGGGSTYGVAIYGVDTYGGSAAAVGVFAVEPVGFSGVGGPAVVPAVGVFAVEAVGFAGVGGPVVIIAPPPIGTARPVPIVEVAFATNPTQPPLWTDISAYVQSFSFSRGRQRELNVIDAGTMQLVLDNRDRRFEGNFSGSPYYPNVVPMRRIRIRTGYNGSSYPLYSGYIDSWGQSWTGFQDAEAPITAFDAFAPLALAQVNTSYPAQTSDARINAVLNTVNWTIGGPQWTLGDPVLGILGTSTVLGPVGDRSIGLGQAVISASVLADTAALTHMQDVATSEFGLLFVDATGVVVFYGRNRTVTTQVNLGTFGELELPYVSVEFSDDLTDVWNDVRVTAPGGTPQVAGDATSQNQNFTRTLAITSVLNGDAQALALANILLSRHKSPGRQIVAMTLDPEANATALYPQMLGREIGDQVTVIRRPPAGGSSIVQVSTIQGIAISWDAASGGEWSTAWRLAAVDTSNYWLLNDPINSILGTSTKLFF